jgi:hypothetical protein
MPARLSNGRVRIFSATRRYCGLDMLLRKPSISVERIIGRRKSRRSTRRPPSRKRGRRWAAIGRSRLSGLRSRQHERPWEWPNGGWHSAPSRHPSAAASPTCWHNPVKRWRRERPSYRSCRRKTYSFVSSFRRPHCRDCSEATGSRSAATGVRASLPNHFLHSSDRRIHSASHLQ